MSLRKLTIDDYPEVLRLWLNTPGMGMRNQDDSRESIDKYLKRNPETNFVAEDNGRIVGVILSGHDGRRGYIYHMAVTTLARRQGLGTALLDAATQALKKEGIEKVALVAFTTNGTGNSFWESAGFRERTDLVYRDKFINEEGS